MWNIKRKVGISLIVLCFLLGLITPTIADNVGQPTLELVWETVVETPHAHFTNQFLTTSDGGFVIAGGCEVDGLETPWLVKVNSEGNMVWNYTYSPPMKPHGILRSIIQTSDGGYALSGLIREMTDDDMSTWDLWVLKTDENGKEEWNQTFNGQNDSFDYGSQILTTQDGGFLVSGCTGTREDWAIDYWLLKLDQNGVEEWNKTYDRFSSDQSTALVSLNDGNYLIGGLSRRTSNSDSAHDIWVIKIHENGTKIWDVAFTNNTETMGSWENNLIGTLDGGFLLACYPRASNLYIGKDYRIIKCNNNGEIEWDKTFGSEDFE
ncbi:MAG: hypothetical protein ACW99Q_12700, partial [Candidatus Kariarchaeaceae archaeon]